MSVGFAFAASTCSAPRGGDVAPTNVRNCARISAVSPEPGDVLGAVELDQRRAGNSLGAAGLVPRHHPVIRALEQQRRLTDRGSDIPRRQPRPRSVVPARDRRWRTLAGACPTASASWDSGQPAVCVQSLAPRVGCTPQEGDLGIDLLVAQVTPTASVEEVAVPLRRILGQRGPVVLPPPGTRSPRPPTPRRWWRTPARPRPSPL